MTLPISVVIPHKTSRDLFFKRFCLPSIKTAGAEQIVVVENDGTHGSGGKYRNEGVRQVTQPYLLFSDDDLVWASDAFAELLVALEKSASAGYAYCDYAAIVMPGVVHPKGGNYVQMSRPFNGDQLKQGNYISTMSLMRREVFPGFDESLRQLNDWDLWLTLLDRGVRGVYVPDILFHAYYLDSGMTNSNSYIQNWEIVRKKHNLTSTTPH